MTSTTLLISSSPSSSPSSINNNKIMATKKKYFYDFYNDNNNNNNNNEIEQNNNNNNNGKINNWKIYSDHLIKKGFSKSGIIDLNNGNSESGIEIGYNELQEIIKVLNGSTSISINLLNIRYFIANSSEFLISGHANSASFILRRTNNKVIIGIFDTTLTKTEAHQHINDIFTQITTIDKSESLSHLFI